MPAYSAYSAAPRGTSMLNESLPPLRNKHTSARYSQGAGGLAAAISPARRRFKKGLRTEMLVTAAQPACPIKRRREMNLGSVIWVVNFYLCTLNSGDVT